MVAKSASMYVCWGKGCAHNKTTVIMVKREEGVCAIAIFWVNLHMLHDLWKLKDLCSIFRTSDNIGNCRPVSNPLILED